MGVHCLGSARSVKKESPIDFSRTWKLDGGDSPGGVGSLPASDTTGKLRWHNYSGSTRCECFANTLLVSPNISTTNIGDRLIEALQPNSATCRPVQLGRILSISQALSPHPPR